jgi:hypothetical protein
MQPRDANLYASHANIWAWGSDGATAAQTSRCADHSIHDIARRGRGRPQTPRERSGPVPAPSDPAIATRHFLRLADLLHPLGERQRPPQLAPNQMERSLAPEQRTEAARASAAPISIATKSSGLSSRRSPRSSLASSQFGPMTASMASHAATCFVMRSAKSKPAGMLSTSIKSLSGPNAWRSHSRSRPAA